MKFKKIKLISVFCFLFSTFFNGQNFTEEYDYYPEGQFPYLGGEANFYKDFHDILLSEKLQPCENKEEIYNLKVIVPENGAIKYLVDATNKDDVEKYKCTYNLGLKVVSRMNKFKPVLIDGQKKQAVARFYIIPNDLFENYKEGYVPQGVSANYNNLAGGVNSFRKEVVKRIDTRGYQWNKEFTMIVSFVVNTDGEMEDFQMIQSSGLQEFDQRVMRGIKSIKGKKHKWVPGKINGIPVKTRFKLPLRFGAPEQ